MYNIYKIKSGDTLEHLADRFETTPQRIMDINNLNPGDFLRVGDDIIIPDTAKDYFEYYSIKKGDNLYQIAKRYNINPSLLANLNGLNDNDYIYPGQVLLIPKANYSYYITKEGDTLDSVVNLFGTTRDRFLNENDIVYLLEGQLLVHKTK